MKINRIFFQLVFGFLFCLSIGCSKDEEEHTYIPPDPIEAENERTYNVAYDEVWEALIDYTVEASHSITNYEKESGLLIMTYRVSNIAKLVDCGIWDEETPYIQRNLGFSLSVGMHIRVKETENQTTTVIVDSSYSLRDSSGNTYTFNESNSSTREIKGPAPGTPSTRTCQSTQAAEKSVLDGIDARLGSE